MVNLAHGLDASRFELNLACFTRWGKLLEEIDAGAKEVVVDLSNVTTLYSMTLGMFNNIASKIAKKGGKFSITNINSDIRRVLKATRLDKLIQIK